MVDWSPLLDTMYNHPKIQCDMYSPIRDSGNFSTLNTFLWSEILIP